MYYLGCVLVVLYAKHAILNLTFEAVKTKLTDAYIVFRLWLMRDHNKWKLLAFCIVSPFLLGIFLFLLVQLEVIGDLPSNQEIMNISQPESSDLFASDTTLIAKFYIENRTNITYDQLNPHFQSALLATEDARFFEHNGVDYRSLARVFVKSLLLQQSSGGGSTITQQLVKNTFPRQRYKFLSMVINKYREIIIASKLEKLYSKEEILALYTNTVSFGERAFGLETAAHRFFNKRSSQLTIEEAATLVGMLKAPTYYSPRKYPDRAVQRRNIVLQQMVKYGFLTSNVAEKLKTVQLAIDYQDPSQSNELARYFKDQVKKEFERLTKDIRKSDGSRYDIYKDGLQIHTALDARMQVSAENRMRKHMSALQDKFIASWEGGSLFGKGTRIIDDKILKDPYYKSLKEEGLNSKERLQKFTTNGEREFWTWQGIETRNATKIDSIKHYLSLLHTGILAVDPQSGFVKLWVGGNDFDQFQMDNVLIPRQVGSTFKPIVYLTALEQGMSPCTYFKNERRQYNSYKDWTPKNANNEYGGHYPMHAALMHSINTISVQILFKAGIPKIVSQAYKMGVSSKLAEVPSLVLGTSDVSLYDLTKVYGSLANGGLPVDIKLITGIETKDGDTIYRYQSDNEEDVLPDSIASKKSIDLLNSMLHQVTQAGTAARLHQNFKIPFEIAGKTGTTQMQSDGWFVGYNPDLVVGAWVGTEDRRIHFRNLGTGSGGRTALPLVGSVFEFAASQDKLSNHRDFIPYEFGCPIMTDEEMEERERKTDFFTSLFKSFSPKDSHKEVRRTEDYEQMLKSKRDRRMHEYNEAYNRWKKRFERNLKQNNR